MYTDDDAVPRGTCKVEVRGLGGGTGIENEMTCDVFPNPPLLRDCDVGRGLSLVLRKNEVRPGKLSLLPRRTDSERTLAAAGANADRTIALPHRRR